MHSDTVSKRLELWRTLANEESRDAFVSADISGSLAAQIYYMREDREWTQKALADKVGMAQSRISLLEDPSYDKFTISTLRRLASAFEVGLLVRFVTFSELLERATPFTASRLSPVKYSKDRVRLGSGAPPSLPASLKNPVAHALNKTNNRALEQQPISSSLGAFVNRPPQPTQNTDRFFAGGLGTVNSCPNQAIGM